MFIKKLSLADFRNYEALDIDLEPGISLLVGPNGQGKTNLVEAIRYLSTLSSHRVAGYLPLIRKTKPVAAIRAVASFDGREVLVELALNRESANKAAINKAPASRVRDILGYVTTVTFAPEDLDIVKRDPSNRRAFIDELVVQVWPRFAGIYSDYERVLKQRNTLLKTARATGTKGPGLSTLDAWDASLVKYGSEIVSARMQLVARLQPHLLAAYQSIAVANNEPKILVRSSLVETGSARSLAMGDEDADALDFLTIDDRDQLAEMFTQRIKVSRDKELERGITLIGPHRDELVLMLGDLPAKGFASHGESWSYALALRLASIELLRQETRSGDPILILDDVFAELDSGRRERLAELIKSTEQVLITAAVEEDVPASLSARVFHVKQGTVSRADS